VLRLQASCRSPDTIIPFRTVSYLYLVYLHYLPSRSCFASLDIALFLFQHLRGVAYTFILARVTCYLFYLSFPEIFRGLSYRLLIVLVVSRTTSGVATQSRATTEVSSRNVTIPIHLLTSYLVLCYFVLGEYILFKALPHNPVRRLSTLLFRISFVAPRILSGVPF